MTFWQVVFQYASFFFIGMYLVLGGTFALLLAKAYVTFIGWLINAVSPWGVSEFDPSKDYGKYAKVKIGTKIYYITNIVDEEDGPITYWLSEDKSVENTHIVLTKRKPTVKVGSGK